MFWLISIGMKMWWFFILLTSKAIPHCSLFCSHSYESQFQKIYFSLVWSVTEDYIGAALCKHAFTGSSSLFQGKRGAKGNAGSKGKQGRPGPPGKPGSLDPVIPGPLVGAGGDGDVSISFAITMVLSSVN